MHLSAEFGNTIAGVRSDGFEHVTELDFVCEPQEPAGDAARAIHATATAIRHDKPDALMVVGDRTETLAAGLAATICCVPLVHLHGGEETEGAIDNVCRHALTKLSHLHLVSHDMHARRVIQMGEDPKQVVVVGAPGTDNLYRTDLPDLAALERELGGPLTPPVVVVTVHPTTLATGGLEEVHAVATAMGQHPATYVVTQPNADKGGDLIRDYWRQWAEGRESVFLVDALGERLYWGLLRVADCVLGNSSSGIIEAPEASIPSVNVGDRQKGRLRRPSIKDTVAKPDAVLDAMRWALSRTTRAAIAKRADKQVPGPVAPRILAALESWTPAVPPRKRFRDVRIA
jgi:UDP-hydrolysing UDP-N-acetyl-D-glucosamine 2-epimerase